MSDNQYTVIIPTVLKAKKQFLSYTVRHLQNCSFVRQIILINNSKKITPDNLRFSKVKIIHNTENFFVNPSWNQGVKVSSTDNIVLLNDDLYILPGFWENLSNLNFKEALYGIDKSCIVNSNSFNDSFFLEMEHKNYSTTNLQYRELSNRTWGFGICMAFHRSNWVDIPSQLKIWCGDDFMCYVHKQKGKKIRSLSGYPVFTEMSSTSDESNLFGVDIDRIKQNDLNHYKLLDKNFWYK